jgi:hypothetical protein
MDCGVRTTGKGFCLSYQARFVDSFDGREPSLSTILASWVQRTDSCSELSLLHVTRVQQNEQSARGSNVVVYLSEPVVDDHVIYLLGLGQVRAR